MPVREGGIAHAQRECREHRRGARRLVRVDDQVHRALAIEHHLARAVARHGGEAQLLQERAELLRLGGGVLDELQSVDAERVGRLGQVFPGGHSGSMPACLTTRPHLSISALITSPNCSGVPPWISTPAAESLERTSSCLSAALMPPFSFATMSFDVPAGARIPPQVLAS